MRSTEEGQPPMTMDNRQRWAIVRSIHSKEDTMETMAAKKTLTKEERARKALLKEEERAAAKAVREQEKAAKKAAKEAAKPPPKKRGRPPKVEPSESVPLSPMPAYPKLEMLRTFAEDVCAGLGAGHLESIYHAAMAVELRLAGVMYESEQVMPVTHKGHYVGTVRADIIVAKDCVLEFKISGKIDDAKQQARQYMKLQGIPYGFVVMFPKVDGGKVQFVDARSADE